MSTTPSSNSAMTALRVTKLEHEVQTHQHKIHATADVINNLIEALMQVQSLTFALAEKLAPEFLLPTTPDEPTPENEDGLGGEVVDAPTDGDGAPAADAAMVRE